MKKGPASEEAGPCNTRNQAEADRRSAAIVGDRCEEAAAVRWITSPREEGATAGETFGWSADEPSGVTASLASTETLHWTTSFQ
jgi:hypothetical protein